MSPRRAAVVILTVVLGVLMAIGAFAGPARTLSDDDYISIAISQPQVFHPSGTTSGRQVTPIGVSRESGSVVVDVVSDGQRFRVFIDPRTNQVTQVVKQ